MSHKIVDTPDVLFKTQEVYRKQDVEDIRERIAAVFAEKNIPPNQRFFFDQLLQRNFTPIPHLFKVSKGYLFPLLLQRISFGNEPQRMLHAIFHNDPTRFMMHLPREVLVKCINNLSKIEVETLFKNKCSMLRGLNLSPDTIDIVGELLSNEDIEVDDILLASTLHEIVEHFPRIAKEVFDYVLAQKGILWYAINLEKHLKQHMQMFPLIKNRINREILESVELIQELLKTDGSTLIEYVFQIPEATILRSFKTHPPASWEEFDSGVLLHYLNNLPIEYSVELFLIKDTKDKFFFESAAAALVIESCDDHKGIVNLFEGIRQESISRIVKGLIRTQKVYTLSTICTVLNSNGNFNEFVNLYPSAVFNQLIYDTQIPRKECHYFIPFMTSLGIRNFIDLLDEESKKYEMNKSVVFNGLELSLIEHLVVLNDIEDIEQIFIEEFAHACRHLHWHAIAVSLYKNYDLTKNFVKKIFSYLPVEMSRAVASVLQVDELIWLSSQKGVRNTLLLATLYDPNVLLQFVKKHFNYVEGAFNLSLVTDPIDQILFNLENSEKRYWYEKRVELDQKISVFLNFFKNLDDCLEQIHKKAPFCLSAIEDHLEDLHKMKLLYEEKFKTLPPTPQIPDEWCCPISAELIRHPTQIICFDDETRQSFLEPTIYDAKSLENYLQQYGEPSPSPMTRRPFSRESIRAALDWAELDKMHHFFSNL